MLKIIFSVQVTFLLFIPFAFGQKGISIIDSVMTATHNEGKLNGNVLIAEKGQIVYNRSFGFANETTKEKLNENSVFGLASVSKQFTAMAIAILKEQGKLNYDDKITKYLPELTAYDNIRIRNLLTHTSGFQDFEQLMRSREALEYMSTHLSGKVVRNNDVVAFFSMHKPKLKFDPGTKSEYCDIGYVFLGSIIEKVSGLPYDEFLGKTIFEPLGMNSTFVLSPKTTPDKINNYALGYIYSGSFKKYLSADSLIASGNMQIMTDGPGGVYSTVIDLLKWDRALYTEQLVSFTNLKEIFEPAVLSDNTSTSYGFGWFIRQDPNFGKCVYHSGGDRGYITYIERNIEHDKTIIILENHDQGVFPVDLINFNLYNIAFPNEAKLSHQQLDAFSGTYEIQKGFEFKIWSENGNIYSQATGQKVLPLFAEDELTLFAKAVYVKLQFEKNKQGKITCLYILQHGDKTRAEKKY
ncbi:MAG: beta-lactamase family protein [Bacteroidales bacterium]|nr:beta-lactamase family protein [Bacteroidales bacterium]